MISHGSVEVLGNRKLFSDRTRNLAMHENAWFKTIMPAPVRDIFVSMDQRRQLQLSVEGVRVSVLSTFNLGMQQGAMNSHVQMNSHSVDASATMPAPPLQHPDAATGTSQLRSRSSTSRQV